MRSWSQPTESTHQLECSCEGKRSWGFCISAPIDRLIFPHSSAFGAARSKPVASSADPGFGSAALRSRPQPISFTVRKKKRSVRNGRPNRDMASAYPPTQFFFKPKSRRPRSAVCATRYSLRPGTRDSGLGGEKGKCQYRLAKGNSKRDLTISFTFNHVPGVNAASFGGNMEISITGRARPVCWIFWTPSAAIVPPNSPIDRRWPPTCLPSSNCGRRWAQGNYREHQSAVL